MIIKDKWYPPKVINKSPTKNGSFTQFSTTMGFSKIRGRKPISIVSKASPKHIHLGMSYPVGDLPKGIQPSNKWKLSNEKFGKNRFIRMTHESDWIHLNTILYTKQKTSLLNIQNGYAATENYSRKEISLQTNMCTHYIVRLSVVVTEIQVTL